MNRREFLGWVGVGGVASSLPVALAACSNQTNQSEVTPVNAEGFVTVGTMTELQQKGQLSQDQILVIPSSSNPKEIIAVNPSCTHAGCTVTWEKDQNAFVCPCHNSQFASDGKVIHGPAKDALPTYTTKQEGDKILVKTS